MNKKLLVAAVSAAVMAPVAAQAAPEVTLYGRIHQSIQIRSQDAMVATAGPDGVLSGKIITDYGDDNAPGGTGANADVEYDYATDNVAVASQGTTNINSISSRWGIKATSNLGNGMTASAQYEFGVTTDSTKNLDGTGVDEQNLRVAKVQLDGDFGSIAVGNQWSAFYNSVGAHMDPTYAIGTPAYLSQQFRTGNTIKYTTVSGGPVVVEFDYRSDENPTGQTESGFGVGLNADLSGLLNGLSLSAAIDNTSTKANVNDATGEDEDYIGLALRYDLGSFFVALSYNEVDIELGTLGAAANVSPGKIEGTQLWIGADFGESSAIMLGHGTRDVGFDVGIAGGNFNAALKTTSTALGIYHDIGGGFKVLYEGRTDSHELNGIDLESGFTEHNFGVRLDF